MPTNASRSSELPPGAPAAGPPRFDSTHNLWLLSRYDHVVAALKEPKLVPSAGGVPPAGIQQAVHHDFRRAAAPTLPEPAEWQHLSKRLAREQAGSLRGLGQCDLSLEYCGPFGLSLASALVGVPSEEAQALSTLAEDVLFAAAHPFDLARQQRGNSAAADLGVALGGGLAVQAFVALSQTLPRFLANACVALLRHPRECRRLAAEPHLLLSAVDELLRLVGPSRALLRTAACDLEIAGIRFERNQLVGLLIAEANRDPDRFPDPDGLDLGRTPAGHVAFGFGEHRCIGEFMVRAATVAALRELVQPLGHMQLRASPKWGGGFAIRWVQSAEVTVSGMSTSVI